MPDNADLIEEVSRNWWQQVETAHKMGLTYPHLIVILVGMIAGLATKSQAEYCLNCNPSEGWGRKR